MIFFVLTSYCTLQALTYAKEAHRLRSKMFEEKFRFSVEEQLEKSNETRDVGQKFTCSLKDLQVRRSVANEFWSFDTTSLDMESCYLSPWIILQCYLESTLQVWLIVSFYKSRIEFRVTEHVLPIPSSLDF